MKVILEHFFVESYEWIQKVVRGKYEHMIFFGDFLSVILTLAFFGLLELVIGSIFLHGNEKFIVDNHPIRNQQRKNRKLYEELLELQNIFELQFELRKMTPEELLFTDMYREGTKVSFFMKESMFIEKRSYIVSNIDDYLKGEFLDFSCLDEMFQKIKEQYKTA